MEIKTKIKKAKIKEFLRKLPKILAEQAFLAFLILVFIALVFGGVLFYKYAILAQRVEPEITKKPLQFKQALFQKILKKWKTREKRFKETELKEYPDPFR